MRLLFNTSSIYQFSASPSHASFTVPHSSLHIRPPSSRNIYFPWESLSGY
ncbi:unnamed protein product [Rhodiola kirilowii]